MQYYAVSIFPSSLPLTRLSLVFFLRSLKFLSLCLCHVCSGLWGSLWTLKCYDNFAYPFPALRASKFIFLQSKLMFLFLPWCFLSDSSNGSFYTMCKCEDNPQFEALSITKLNTSLHNSSLCYGSTKKSDLKGANNLEPGGF